MRAFDFQEKDSKAKTYHTASNYNVGDGCFEHSEWSA